MKVLPHRHHLRQQNYGTSHQSSTTSWAWPWAVLSYSIQCRKQHQYWLQFRVRHQRASRKLKWQYTILPCRRLRYQLVVQKLQWQSLSMEDLRREKQRQLVLTYGLNQRNSEVRKSASKAKSFILRSIPEPLCNGLLKLRMLKLLTSSLPQHLWLETQLRTSRILISRLQADSAKSWQEPLRNKSPQQKAELDERRDQLQADIAWMI